MRKPLLSIEQQQTGEPEPGPFDTSELTTFRDQAALDEQQRARAWQRINRDYTVSNQDYVNSCIRRLVNNESFFWRWPPLHDGTHIDYYDQGVRVGYIRSRDAGE